LTLCRSPRKKVLGPRDGRHFPLVGHPPRREYRLSGQIHTSTVELKQFTSDDFTGTLQNHAVTISMDGKGRYKDNIFVERLWRSLKYEEVYLNAYARVADAKAGIGTSSITRSASTRAWAIVRRAKSMKHNARGYVAIGFADRLRLRPHPHRHNHQSQNGY
jgi:transposase InsO family protein